jgi:hypothetical protein
MAEPLKVILPDSGAFTSTCLYECASLFQQINEGGITDGFRHTPPPEQENSDQKTYESTPLHFSSFTIRAVKTESLVSGHFQAFLDRPALRQVWHRKVS